MADSSIRVHREPAPRALVVGLGISGTASALALHRAGWEPVIIERAPQRRRGGYFMAIFGAGRYAAQDLGVGDRLANHRSPEPTTYTIDRTGHRRPGLGFGDLPINPYLTMRDDVEEAIYDTLREQAPDVSIRFGTTPRAISQDADGVDVTLTGPDGTTTERFDLVVGADGIHSQVRRLVFAPDSEAIDRMGTMICAFALTDDLPTLPRGMGARLLEPNRAFHVFPFDDRPSTVLFSYGTDDVKAEKRVPVAARLREVYGHDAELGPVLEAAITQLEDGRPALFDAVEQVHLPSWHRGRVVLVGDSAWCPSLYSGMARPPASPARTCWACASRSIPATSRRRWTGGSARCARTSGSTRRWASTPGRSSPPPPVRNCGPGSGECACRPRRSPRGCSRASCRYCRSCASARCTWCEVRSDAGRMPVNGGPAAASRPRGRAPGS